VLNALLLWMFLHLCFMWDILNQRSVISFELWYFVPKTENNLNFAEQTHVAVKLWLFLQNVVSNLWSGRKKLCLLQESLNTRLSWRIFYQYSFQHWVVSEFLTHSNFFYFFQNIKAPYKTFLRSLSFMCLWILMHSFTSDKIVSFLY